MVISSKEVRRLENALLVDNNTGEAQGDNTAEAEGG
jgi:hypothetical protein